MVFALWSAFCSASNSVQLCQQLVPIITLQLLHPLELELELDASVNPNYPTNDIGEESWNLCIYPLLSLRWQSNFRLKTANEHPKIISSSKNKSKTSSQRRHVYKYTTSGLYWPSACSSLLISRHAVQFCLQVRFPICIACLVLRFLTFSDFLRFNYCLISYLSLNSITCHINAI